MNHHRPLTSPSRVCSFESRRAAEMKSLIERHQGIATIAPSMREVPLDDNPEAFEFARNLLAGRFDIVVFMTGVGASALLEVLETRYSRADLFRALDATTVVVRGPKPSTVLRSWNVHVDYRAPEPNTWREVLQLMDASVQLNGRSVAIQEYGQPSVPLYEALQARGAIVTPITVYRWALPVDLAPLQEAIRKTIAGEFDLLLFTSAQQFHHVLEVADRMGLRDNWLQAANTQCRVASIGPTATETLRTGGLRVDFEPSHPNMGSLVKESLAATL